MTDLDAALDRIRPEVIDAHLRFLAHPLLEGRAPGTRGGELAAEYIRAQFQRSGLCPVEGSYLHPVPLVGLTPEPRLEIFLPGGEVLEPAYRDTYVLRSGIPEAEVEAEGELVFVGHGITAPEYDWDDFKDEDVRGKILLVRVNDPGTEATPGFFGGKALTYYGRWTYKYEEASRRGAAGVLLIHTDESAGYGWNVVRSTNTGEQFDLAGAPEFPLRLKGWISEGAVLEALRRAGHDPDELLRRSGERGFRPVPTGIRVQARVRSAVREVRTANVAGLLPGSDPERGGEVVILTAHYDHLGTGTAEDGKPVVYHGAYDNASGVSVLMAIAEAAATLPRPPARSLLFVATTAEESGLLGSEWYARHPLVPLERTAAALNLDGASLWGRTRDLVPTGADRSELIDPIAEAARAEGLTIQPNPHPEQGIYFRQDHFPLARAGIPAVTLDHGLSFERKPEGWGEEWYEEFLTRHYHQPSDAYRDDFDYSGAVQQGRVMLRSALSVASADRFPEWSEEAEFGRRVVERAG